MTSTLNEWLGVGVPQGVHLLEILILALVLNYLLRRLAAAFLASVVSAGNKAPTHQEQLKTFVTIVQATGSKVVWMAAVLTALPELGINPMPAVILSALLLLGLLIGARNILRDAFAGLQIASEDWYRAGDTIQSGDITGRVERITLQNTVVRDARGALVTLSHGELREVSNLSRDWSQTFVDVFVPGDTTLEKALEAVEAASAEFRADPLWSQALVDGPRVLGIQEGTLDGLTLRLQVRTLPTRQDEVSRELRRRVHLEFHKLREMLNRSV